MNALKLADKVKQIIERHIRKKGYEIEVTLETPKPGDINRPIFTIEDDGTDSNGVPIEPHREQIKIVVTGHSLEENETKIGDNPNEVLDFIVINDSTEPDERQVKEGRILVYNGKRYNVMLAAPAALAGQLIIKECQAR